MPGLEDVWFVELLLWLVRRSARTPVMGAIGEKLDTILVERGFILCVLQAFHVS
jgi:hypothetical protein